MLPWGTAATACSTARASEARSCAGEAASSSAKTTVNEPSERSPKCAWRVCRTCSDAVPGTEKVFERIAESFELAKPPSRKTTIQSASTLRRCRITKRVHSATAPNASDSFRAMTRRERMTPQNLQAEIEELFSELWHVPRFAGMRRGFRPMVDSYRTDDPPELTVIVEVPGIDPKSLTIVVSERTLAVSGERVRDRSDGRVYQQMEIEYGPFSAADPARRGRRPRRRDGAVRARDPDDHASGRREAAS